MDFWKAILGLIRRRYVALPILILSIGVAALAYLLTPPRYVSSTTMVLTTPTAGGTFSQDPSKPTGLTNPLLSFNDGLKTTSAILIQAMNTPAVIKELTGGGASKLVVDDGRGNANLLGVNGPFVYLEGDSTGPDEARAVVQRAQQWVRDELVNRQKALNAPPSTYITIVDVVPPSAPEVQRSLQIQYAVAGLVLTILGGLAGAYGAERMFASRRKRATAEPARLTPPRPIDLGSNAVDPATVRFSPVPQQTNGNGAPHPQVPVGTSAKASAKHPAPPRNPAPAKAAPSPAKAPAKAQPPANDPATVKVPAPANHQPPTNHPAPGSGPAPKQPSGPTNGVDAPMPKPIRTR